MEAQGRTFAAGIRAAFGLAYRMTGSHASAEEAVLRAARRGPLPPAELVHAVRGEARALPGRPVRESVARPEAYHAVALGDWEIVERVALRGMTVTEAAADAGTSRADAMLRLQRGMRAARVALEERQARHDAETPAAGALGGDGAAGGLDDPPGDRQAEAASFPGLPR
jgi:hypothetical protein